MADLLFVCVHDDLPSAEALADVFEAGGFTISDSASDIEDAGAVLVLCSAASLSSRVFLDTAARADRLGNAIVINVDGDAPRRINGFKVLDISKWNGEADSDVIDPLFRAVNSLVIASRAAPEFDNPDATADEHVYDQPSFAPPTIQARAWRASSSPNAMVRVLAFAMVLGGSALAAGLTAGHLLNGVTADVVESTAQAAHADARVAPTSFAKLAGVGGDFIALEDAAADPEAPATARRGLEPPSASSLTRAVRRDAALREASFEAPPPARLEMTYDTAGPLDLTPP